MSDHEARIRSLETRFSALEAQLTSEMKHINEKFDILFDKIDAVNENINSLSIDGAVHNQKSTMNEKGLAVLIAVVFSVAGFFLSRGFS